MAKATLFHQSTPERPDTGFIKLFPDKDDGNKVKMIDENGNVTDLTASAPTDAQVKTQYESNANTNEFSDSEKSKLSGLESSKFLGEYISLGALQSAHPTPVVGSYANVDAGSSNPVERYVWDSDDNEYQLQLGVSTLLTNAQIKTQYEGNDNTNPFEDLEKTKLTNLSVRKTAYIWQRATNGTHGGTATANTIHDRPITDISGDTSFISIDVPNKTFTLDTGTYEIPMAWAAGSRVNSHKLFLYNETDSVYVSEMGGGNARSTVVSGESGTSNSIIFGTFTIAAQKTFKFKHWFETGRVDYGMGYRAYTGTNPQATETYLGSTIIKIG